MSAAGFGEDPRAAVERAFAAIAAGGMADLPLSNPALAVEAVGFRAWQGHWLGVLVTPWAINLLLLPGERGDLPHLPLGERQSWQFPAAELPFMGGSAEGLGSFQFCSLFSPTFEFSSQEDARTAATAAIAALFDVPAAPPVVAAAPELSRRGFLRGKFLGRAP